MHEANYLAHVEDNIVDVLKMVEERCEQCACRQRRADWPDL